MWRSATVAASALAALLAACSSSQPGQAAVPASAAAPAAPAGASGSPATPSTPPPSTAPSNTPAGIPGDGTFAVGSDIKPGTYRTTGPAPGIAPNCYWERDKDLSGTLDGIIANGSSTGPAIVQVQSTDAAFKTSGCQPWTLVATKVVAAPPASTPAPPLPAPPTTQQGGDAASVVEAYYAAINARDYATAWNLGGSHFSRSYDTFVADFANTSVDNLAVTSVSGNRVYIDLTAYNRDGTVQHFSGYYIVNGGVLTDASVH